jgi:MFS family permease
MSPKPFARIPIVGRNPPYLAMFAIFVILCVPTALVKNIASLLVLRFLLGFFGKLYVRLLRCSLLLTFARQDRLVWPLEQLLFKTW